MSDLAFYLIVCACAAIGIVGFFWMLNYSHRQSELMVKRRRQELERMKGDSNVK